VVDRNRHAPSGRYRRLRSAADREAGGLTQVYHGRARRTHTDIYAKDHVGGGRFRWFLSTCLAGFVALCALAIVVFGSVDRTSKTDNVLDRISQSQTTPPTVTPRTQAERGLNWAMPKSDRLELATGALTARYTIHEQVRTRRNNRPFIAIRPYLRVVARLAPRITQNADVIPPFNPFTLYASQEEDPKSNTADPTGGQTGKVQMRVVELVGGILPRDDGQELDNSEINALVQREQRRLTGSQPLELVQTGQIPAGLTPAYLETATASFNEVNPSLTVLTRTMPEPDHADDESEAAEVRIVKVAEGDSLSRILQRMGIKNWQIAAIVEVSIPVFPPEAVRAGQEIHVRLTRSLTDVDYMEPLSLSIFDPGHIHRLTVKRNPSGEFSASTDLDQASLFRAMLRDDTAEKTSNLYSAIYDAGLTQKLPPELILKILRIHVYETDYRRRVQNGDQIELFFDMVPQTEGDARLGELLYSAISTAGETQQFWRFRTKDGIVDYYDEKGRNAKKFLMRKPIRGANVRFTSGYGYRYHPVHGSRRMHTGVDYAGPYGTPILAAGRGLVEEAGRKGGYGNYIRIRHANGYQTAYAHMSRIASNIRPGVNVRQGQIIGFLGSTGISTGAHLHFEVLVNNQYVDPLKIEVPRARELQGPELAAFKSEKNRISTLMRRPPVKTYTR
jgi:murein DD-endopeptidase MepM/ murein hydrolase activator NlpD